jgi:hypothetical protein
MSAAMTHHRAPPFFFRATKWIIGGTGMCDNCQNLQPFSEILYQGIESMVLERNAELGQVRRQKPIVVV